MKAEKEKGIAPTSVGDLVDGPLQEILPSEEPDRTAALNLYEMIKKKELSEPISSARMRAIAKTLLEALSSNDVGGVDHAGKKN